MATVIADRRLPSGRELANVLHRFRRRLLSEALAAAKRGEQPRLTRHAPALAELIRPLFQRWFVAGYRDAGPILERAVRHRSIGFRDVVRKRLYPTGPGPAPISLGFDVFRPEVLDQVSRLALDFAASTLETAQTETWEAARDWFRATLASGLEAGDAPRKLTERIAAIFSNPHRALLTAVTEASRATHAGEFAAIGESGIVKGKKWLASSDACERCEKMAKRGELPLDEPFDVSGKGTYAVCMYPPLHPSCFCSVTYTF